MKALDPLVHRNSQLRLQYQSLVGKFKEAVAGASALLKKAGLTTPTLSGLGVAPLVIVGVALIALAAAFTLYETVRVATDAQRRSTAEMSRIIEDPNATPEQKKAALDALQKGAGMPSIFGELTPILGIVAVIVIGPSLLRMFQNRRAAA
jgi:hypothetical protein